MAIKDAVLRVDSSLRRPNFLHRLLLPEGAEDALSSGFGAATAQSLSRLSRATNLLRVTPVAGCTPTHVVGHLRDISSNRRVVTLRLIRKPNLVSPFLFASSVYCSGSSSLTNSVSDFQSQVNVQADLEGQTQF